MMVHPFCGHAFFRTAAAKSVLSTLQQAVGSRKRAHCIHTPSSSGLSVSVLLPNFSKEEGICRSSGISETSFNYACNSTSESRTLAKCNPMLPTLLCSWHPFEGCFGNAVPAKRNTRHETAWRAWPAQSCPDLTQSITIALHVPPRALQQIKGILAQLAAVMLCGMVTSNTMIQSCHALVTPFEVLA